MREELNKSRMGDSCVGSVRLIKKKASTLLLYWGGRTWQQ